MQMKSRRLASIAVATLLAGSQVVFSEEPQINYSAIPIVRLWPGDAPATQPVNQADPGEEVVPRGSKDRPSLMVSKISHPWLAVFNAIDPDIVRPAVIICPGGGYRFESMTDEGFSVAQRFNAAGIRAFILKYRLPHGVAPASDKLPAPQEDVLRAIQLVRSHAAEWKIDPKRIGVVGFSAGGHLAATAATMYDDAKQLPATDTVSHLSARPDFAVLVYPVISMEPGVGHAGSRNNLIGSKADETLSARFSADQQVTSDTPPLFVTMAKDDKTVPFHNAELIIAAAEKAGVAHAFVPFDHGGHGFGLGRGESKAWLPQCLDWLRTQHLIDPAK